MDKDTCFNKLAELQDEIQSNVAAGDEWAADVDTAIDAIFEKYTDNKEAEDQTTTAPAD